MGSIGYFEAASEALKLLEERIHILEERAPNSPAEIARSTALTDDLADIRQILAAQDNQLAALRMFRAASQPIVDDQSKQLSALQDEVMRTQAVLGTQQTQIDCLKNDLVIANDFIRTLQETVKPLQVDVRTATDTIELFANTNSSLQQEAVARDKFVTTLADEVHELGVRTVRTLPCTISSCPEHLPLLPKPNVSTWKNSRCFLLNKPEHFSPVLDIDPTKQYEVTMDIRCDEQAHGCVYLAVKCLDARLAPIPPSDILRKGKPCTVMAFDRDANTLTLDRDVSNEWFNDATPCHQRSLAFYCDGASDRVRPDIVLQNTTSAWNSERTSDGAYSRIDGQVLYLNMEIPPLKIIPQVSKVWNHYSGGKYMYPAEGSFVEAHKLQNRWHTLSGRVGTLMSKWARSDMLFWKGTRFMQVGVVLSGDGTALPATLVRHIHVKELKETSK